MSAAELFTALDTIVPFIAAAEVGRYLTRNTGRQPVPADTSRPRPHTPSTTQTT